ncbi:hypothetical protein QTV49_004630 [Vibrio vulnificus]|nr:hypothetical protein [Vibrio vulnificus]
MSLGQGQYYCYIENCDHEGEEWSRFVSVSDPHLERLLAAVERYSELTDQGEEFSFMKNDDGTLTTFEHDEAIEIVEDEDSWQEASYMDAEGFAKIREDFPSDLPNSESICDALYKMQWMQK